MSRINIEMSANQRMFSVNENSEFVERDGDVFLLAFTGKAGKSAKVRPWKLGLSSKKKVSRWEWVTCGESMVNGDLVRHFKLGGRRANLRSKNPAISIEQMAVVFEKLTMDKPIKSIARSLGVHPSTLQRRIIRAESEGFMAFRGRKNDI
jgi:hypothetical protein